MRRLKTREIPTFKAKVIKDQEGICPLCLRPMNKMEQSNIVLDHDHESGMIRGALCRNCNGAEGKIKGLAIHCSNKQRYKEWLGRLMEYLGTTKYSYTHPTYRTPMEDRALKNKRARARYKASKKDSKNKQVKIIPANVVYEEVE